MTADQAKALYTPRMRQDNLAILGGLMSAQSPGEQELAFRHGQEHFHPSLLAECDYRARLREGEHWQSVAHKAITLYLFTLHQNTLPRPPHPSIAVNRLVAALEGYRSSVEGKGPTLAEHLSIAKRTQGAILSSAPSCASKLERLIADVQVEVSSCRAGSKLVAIVEATLENATLLLLDAPATRIDALAYIFWWREAKGTNLSAPVYSVETSEQLSQLRSWLGELQDTSRRAELGQLSEVASTLSSVLDSKGLEERAVFDGEWSRTLVHCSRCSMIFASKSPTVLDQDCPSIGTGEGFLFFKRELNRAVCVFCGNESHLEVPGFLYWRARNLVVYRLPLTPFARQEEVYELCRPAVEAMRERYMARLTEVERDKFEHAVEIVAHGWDEWLYAVQMGDVVTEDHVVLIETPEGDEGGRIMIDITKMFIRELGDEEFRNVNVDAQRRVMEQMEALDKEVVDRIVRRVIEDVSARLERNVDAATSDERSDS
jgi:hypothetical protein